MTEAPRIFDRALYLHRQQQASGDAGRLLFERLATELGERLEVINRSFDKALVIAPDAVAFLPVLQATGKCLGIECQSPRLADDLGLPPATFDAVFSLMDIHAVDDVPGYMAQVAASLKPDGLALFSFFAGETLRELREAWLSAEQSILDGVSPRVAPMIDLRESGGLLQRAGLALPVADMDRLALRYADAFALMREVKTAGFANCLVGRSNTFASRRLLLAVAETYAQIHAHADGRIPATLDIAWAMAWKPHPSQQQPLKPGSAKARLADALRVDERKI